MRIERIDLTAFGPFTGAQLHLRREGQGGLHLIHGPNEAGKSSALRAVKAFFRGIPAQTNDNFLHDYKNLRIGMVLRDHSGKAVELVRRKGQKNTLLGAGGEPADDAAIAKALGGMPPEEYVNKFVIDHAEMIAGGQDVIGGKGDLGRVLFAAGAGLGGIGKIQKSLDEEAEALFKKGGKNPRINSALSSLEDHKKATRDASLKATEWLEHDRALSDAQRRKDQFDHDDEAASRELRRLERLAEALEPIARRAMATGRLRELADAPRLDAEFSSRRRGAQEFLAIQEPKADALSRKIEDLLARREALEVPSRLLDEAEAIASLQVRRGREESAAEGRDKAEVGWLAAESDARAVLRELGRDPALLDDPAALEALRLKAPDRAELQELIASRESLHQALVKALKDRERVAAKGEALSAKLAALGPTRDPAPLRKALKSAQAAGDLDQMKRNQQAEAKREARKAESAAERLGRWSGSLEALEALEVPAEATVETFRDGFDGARKEAGDLKQGIEKLGDDDRRVACRLDAIRLAGDVPTETDLLDARAGRDGQWRAIRGRRELDEAAAQAFETATRLADDLSDRLRREADRVAERASLAAEATKLAADRAELIHRLEKCQQRQSDLESQWNALWSPLGIESPGNPAEMREWLRAHAKATQLAAAAREAATAAAEIDEAIAANRQALITALRAAGETVEDGSCLEELIESTSALIETITEEIREHKRLHKEVESHQRDMAAAEDLDAEARTEWDRWRARWSAASGRIGEPADTPSSRALAVLEWNNRLFDAVDRAGGHRRELEELTRSSARFLEDVRVLATRAAPDLIPERPDAFDPQAIVAELNRRLTEGREARQSHENLSTQIVREQADLEAIGQEIRDHRARLAQMTREAGCESLKELPEAEQRARERLELENELRGLDATLGRLAAGLPLEEFLAEAEQADPDSLATRQQRLREEIEALKQERHAASEAIGREKSLLAQMDGNPRAADAGQEAEDLRARIRAEVEHYARLRLASAILRAGIERYREKAQAPILGRAERLFKALTLGSFTGLKVDYDDADEPVLKGVRGAGQGPGAGSAGSPIAVEGMSLGTADQLYLSLRLATLDAFLDTHEPLPLIVDDVLIQFDNARAAAALETLASLATRAQVLLFTHHEHLRDLARAIVPSGLLITHDLPGPVTPLG